MADVRVRSTVADMFLISKWVARGLSGGHNSNFGKLRLAVCTVWCRYGSTDLGELSSVGKRWTVPVVQRALCPPVCRSLGGHALSEDGRRCSFELPTHSRFAVQYYVSSTLDLITVFSDGRMRALYDERCYNYISLVYLQIVVPIWRPPAAQRRRPRRGVLSHARRHSPPPPRGGRW
jgi:hypothetical protein